MARGYFDFGEEFVWITAHGPAREGIVSIDKAARFVERGHADVDVDHKLLVHRSDRRKKAHQGPKLRTERPLLVVIEEISVFAESVPSMRCLLLKNEIQCRNKRVDLVFWGVDVALEVSSSE